MAKYYAKFENFAKAKFNFKPKKIKKSDLPSHLGLTIRRLNCFFALWFKVFLTY